MEQNKNNENNENYLAIFEAAKQLEKEAKEVVEKEINNITMNDIQQILKKLTSLLTVDPTFPKGIHKYEGEKKQKNIVFLFHKLKYICFKKGIPVCFLLIDPEALHLIYWIEMKQRDENLQIINTNELMEFVFLKVFRTGESNSRYLKYENDFIKYYKNRPRVLKFNFELLNQPMKPPETDLERLFTKYMILMNSEWKNENYLKFSELYKQYKFNEFETDFCNYLKKIVTQKQKEYLTKMNKNIEPENIALKDKTFFIENETIKNYKNDGINYLIENINIIYYDKQCELEKSDYNLLIKLICAFLNSEGGRIYIGFNDEGKVSGISIRNKEKDMLNGYLNNFLTVIHPSIRKGEIKVYFIPIKNNNDEFIENLYIIKIIVPQGNVSNLYSINYKKFESFMIENNYLISLDCQKIKEEIVKRFKKEKKVIDNSCFNDKEPEEAIFPKIPKKDININMYNNNNVYFNTYYNNNRPKQHHSIYGNKNNYYY